MKYSTSAILDAQNDNSETVIDLITTSAKLSPDREAIIFGNTKLTYSEIIRRSDLIAQCLVNYGVTQGDIVAVSLPRSLEAIVALLAGVKTGALFLPVDPNYPLERKRFMLADANPKVLIVENLEDSTVLKDSSYRILVSKELNIDSELNVSLPKLYAANPAYLIYTSGSTGKPKGAINTHRGLLNLVYGQVEGFKVNHNSRVLQFASMSFDASISEIFVALCAGATLVLGSQNEMIPGPSLVSLLKLQKVSHVTLPPSVLAVLPENSFPDLEVLVVAGEKCPIELARRWAKNITFINAYGVSEAAVCSSMLEFTPLSTSMPIGKAMRGVVLLAINEEGLEIEAGKIGELYIGGAGVGLGYLNRPELTKERFKCLQFAPGTFYATGDLVRKLPDGSFDYIGRKDNQVKIRGFRIELDEVSKAAERYKEIEQCAVVVHESGSGAKQLVAYFIKSALAHDPISALGSRLKEYLTQQMPAHMVPSYFIRLDSFPLAPTGKIDTKLLQSLEIGKASSDIIRRATTPSEKVIEKILGELLNSDKLDFSSSFLNLGGDSLIAAQLAWRITEECQVNLSESEILLANSIADLARVIETKDKQSLPSLRPVSRNSSVRPSPVQDIYCLLEKFNVDTNVLNCCAAFEICGDLNDELFNRAYAAMFERHESLRSTFPLIEGEYKLTTHKNINPQIEIIDFTDNSNQESELNKIFQTAEYLKFNLATDLLVKSYLVKLKTEKAIFIFVAHHAICDAWSLYILLQDMCAWMLEKSTGVSLLKDSEIQYIDYAVWQREILSAKDNLESDAYYRRIFSKPIPLFDLNGVLPRPTKKSHVGRNLFVRFPKNLTTSLKKFAEKQQMTSYMVLTAVLQKVLLENSCQTDIMVGGPVSIRYHRDLERQVGLLSSSYIARLRARSSETIDEILERTRVDLLEAYKHQVYSIVDVLYNYNIEPDLSRTAPFDVSIASHMFELEFCDREIAKKLGINVIPYRFPLTTSFFDLEFTFHLFDGEIDVEVRYDTALYEDPNIRSIVAQFQDKLATTIL